MYFFCFTGSSPIIRGMTDKVKLTIIGAGIVGLAIAAKATENCESPLLLEKKNHFGMGISSRSSEVIHAGIYYKPGSLKAQLCIKGNHQLYRISVSYTHLTLPTTPYV